MVTHVSVKTAVIPNTSRSYIKATYVDEDTVFSGEWAVSLKMDGIRVLDDRILDAVTTRSGELVRHEIAQAVRASCGDDFELWAGNWSNSMSVLAGTKPFTPDMLIQLAPTVDDRINYGMMTFDNVGQVLSLMEKVVAAGHEGLVLRQGNKWAKAVPKRTADVRTIGFKEGKGRNKGRLGSIETTRGFVSGMSDDLRDLLWQHRQKLVDGLLIEVDYRELHPSGKFRFASFVRIRTDKTEESI